MTETLLRHGHFAGNPLLAELTEEQVDFRLVGATQCRSAAPELCGRAVVLRAGPLRARPGTRVVPARRAAGGPGRQGVERERPPGP
jgi:hypothetical protein